VEQLTRSQRLNGHHVTAIVSAICIAIVLAPVAVVAASTGSRSSTIEKVLVTDPMHAYEARVSSTGALKVGGTVNVGNLPATQPVSGSVNIGNLPTTQNVGGTVTAVPGSPGTPFTVNKGASASFTQFSVPSGKHLTIQTLSVRAAVPTGDKVGAFLDYRTNGADGSLFIPLTFVFTNFGDDWYDATLPVDVYADPSSSVSFTASDEGAGTTAQVILTVSGYLT
jgi:hypothetical protein